MQVLSLAWGHGCSHPSDRAAAFLHAALPCFLRESNAMAAAMNTRHGRRTGAKDGPSSLSLTHVPGEAATPPRHPLAPLPFPSATGGKGKENAYKFNRRMAHREPAAGVVNATYSNGTDRYGIARLSLMDRSHGGMGAWTSTPLEPGMTIALSPVGTAAAWLTGVVARCKQEGDGFHVGLSFAPALAAA